MTTTTSLQFPTGSSFEGSWDDFRACMHGFGCYVFPNGSHYRGYFKSGRFHGFGCLQLEAPYKFLIKGQYRDGTLISIEDMIFKDGLHVRAKAKGKTLDFGGWRYCSSDDRRFPMEISNGLRPVGPTSLTTQQWLQRELEPGYYDTEEGIYHPKAGFVMDRPLPFSPVEFLACNKDVEWIQRNCRKGYIDGERHEPVEEDCRKIMNQNIHCQKSSDIKFADQCKMDLKPGHKYFQKLYIQEMKEAKQLMVGGTAKTPVEFFASNEPPLKGSSSSCPSLSEPLPRDNEMEKRVCEVKKYLLGRSHSSLSFALEPK